jgi:hypothetical protein
MVRAMKSRLLAPGLILALTALSVSSAGGTTTGTRATQTGHAPRQTVARHAAGAYGQLPLAFVRNAGQLDPRVIFAAQAGSGSFFFTHKEAVLALAKSRQGVALRLAFLGANAAPTIVGAGRSSGRVNYIVGSDPTRWHTNLPSYAKVVYRGLWPGVDMRVRGQGGTLKYEFRLAPGADPSLIRLAYRGQRGLSLGRGGALRIETALGALYDAHPVSYQLIGGRRIAVESRFALEQRGAYRFAVGAYDSRYPLVIDPGLVYSTFIGKGTSDLGNGMIAVDRTGNAYVTGSTAESFPTTTGAFDSSFNGVSDAFVTKLNATGSALIYSTYLGGSALDRGWGIAVDDAGSAFVTGTTGSPNFPTTAAAYDTSFNGGPRGVEFDTFVTKLDAAGSALTFSTYLGGSDYDRGGGIALDSADGTYVTGFTRSTDFPTTVGAFDTSLNGTQDTFVTKLNAAGSTLTYSTHLGGSHPDRNLRFSGIAVDGVGNAFVTGTTTSTDFPTTAGAFDTSFNGSEFGDAFVSKLDAAGSALTYSTYLGGGSTDASNGIAVDSAGSAFVTGHTGSSDFPTTPGAFDTSFNGREYDAEAFVAKLNTAGSALVYSPYLDSERVY